MFFKFCTVRISALGYMYLVERKILLKKTGRIAPEKATSGGPVIDPLHHQTICVKSKIIFHC